MDASEYLPMFLAESREHLQELNLAVVRIEEKPDDRETVDEIFRIAHSLKGMSATMGFAGIAALTHEMEDVFELLRQRTGGLDRETIDVAARVPRRARGGGRGDRRRAAASGSSRSALIETPQGLVRARPGAEEKAVEGAAARGRTAWPRSPLGAAYVHVGVQFAEDVTMPSVRAYMALAALAEHGEVLASVPAEESIEDFSGKLLEVWLATEHEDAAVTGAAPRSRMCSAFRSLRTGRRRRQESRSPESGVAESGAELPAEAAPSPDASPAAAKKPSSSTVRVDAERLDQLMHFMGELVVHRTHSSRSSPSRRRPASRTRCRTSRAAHRRCRRWSCRCE